MTTAELSADGSYASVVGSGGDRILSYLKKYKWPYFWGFLALLVATVLALLPPYIVKLAVDDIEAAVQGDGFDIDRGDLLRYGALILGIALTESVLRYVSRRVVSGTARRIEYSLREDLANHLLRLDQGFYVQARTGDLMSRLTNDLQAVRDFLGPTVVDIGRSGAVLVAGFAIMFVIDVRLTLIAFAYLPVVIILMAFFETNIEKRFFEVQDQIAVLTERSQENVSGIRAIKAYAQEDAEIRTFRRENEEMRRRSMRLGTYEAGLLPSMIVLTSGGTLLVLWFGGHAVVNEQISTGDFAMFVFVLTILSSQLMAVGWIVASAQLGVVAIRRINEVFRTRSAIEDGPRALERARGEVEFRDVSVRFGVAEPVLRDINLRVPSGSTVAIVGATGQGKTTLANLVPRLLDPAEGTVLLDGVDVREYRLDDLRQQIGFVPQESYLFSESLRENVSYGRQDASDGEYERALVISQLSNDLKQLTQGIETVIGERGITLSGGQKQRAAIARALLKDPPVLILDDALSHVDTNTEEEILRRLRDYMAGRTTILIAHRTSTLRSADRIVVLEGGTIVEEGSHRDLIAHDGVYARIYREQLALEQRSEDVDADLVEGDRRASDIRSDASDRSNGGRT